tara:strand:- start:816 stop:2156 length:1341 start_codon:yes stop_codon:yes gene_type:complete
VVLKLKKKFFDIFLILIVATIIIFNIGEKQANACAFLNTPHAYESDKNRTAYLKLLEYAASGKLFKGNGDFALPTGEAGTRSNRREVGAELPHEILKSIAWVESEMLMATVQVAYNSKGPALVAFDCGYGIMQITSGMEKPADGKISSKEQVLIATHPSYNIAKGAELLIEKWNQAPQSRPIVGTDTDSDPNILENWYYATWSYNGFSGPGTNKSNHPLDPIFSSWPRPIYTCDGRYPKNQFPYQELVWGCLNNPPIISGEQLWQPVNVSLPNLTDPIFANKLSLSNFNFPYYNMDIPTPQPMHYSQKIQAIIPSANMMLGQPNASISKDKLRIQTNVKNNLADRTIIIRNNGSGLLSWNAYTTYPWIVIEKPAGVAIGKDVKCSTVNCQRESEVIIKINPTLLPDTRAIGKIVIQFANLNIVDRVITVDAFAEFNSGVSGISKIY